MMHDHEYETRVRKVLDPEVQPMLDWMNQNGWRLVSTSTSDPWHYLFFERKKML